MKALQQVPVQKDQTRQVNALQRAPDRQTTRGVSLPDNRPAAVAQRKLQAMISTCPRLLQHRACADMINISPRVLQQKAQMDAIQNSSAGAPAQLAQAAARKPNNTGLPDQLKSGIESLSGMSMDHVKVHYNSSQPAQLNAHAYAQGNNIHVGPGQEKHLPHEAWHVVQQAQGRVRPTMQMKLGVQVNDDKALEAEADVMGSKALQLISMRIDASQAKPCSARPVPVTSAPVLQAQWVYVNQPGTSKINLAATATPHVYVCSADGRFYKVINTATDGYPIVTQMGSTPVTTAVNTFQAGTMHFTNPQGGAFSAQSAWNATQPYANGTMATLTNHSSGDGVKIGDVGSYKAIQHLEKTGDQLTGDHQPSGAAIKEAIRQQLHAALNQVLTRSMGNVAYQKAITVVMSDAWHKAESRTYGGRNSKAQISHDAGDLLGAAMEDWKKTVPELEKLNYTQLEIKQIWTNLETARQAFYKTGDPQIKIL